VRVVWLVYGDLHQPTGGTIYDRLVVDGLRAAGDEVVVRDPRDGANVDGADVVVGDALCVRELGPIFERVAHGAVRVLLVHHLPSWEIERADAPALRALEARALAASDVLVATGAASAARLRRDVPLARIDVVPPGADRLPLVDPATTRARAADGAATFLFVGSLIARKRLAALIGAFEPLAAEREPRPRLVVVGDPAREPDYARAVAARVRASQALRAQVELRGVVDDDAVARAMADADALVVSSSLEGYGMVIAEALHAGTPVVASREAAEAAGVIDHAAVVVLGAEPTWTATLDRVARDPALRDAMRAAARRSTLPRWADAASAFRRAIATVTSVTSVT
jgi:glycosyltransferase involved in cell wall biosynthesis